MRFITRRLLYTIRSKRLLAFILIISLFISIGLISSITKKNKSNPINVNEFRAAEELQPLQQPNGEIKTSPKNDAWPLDDQGRSMKTSFLALDWTGFFSGGANEGEHVQCTSSNTSFVWTRQHHRLNDVDFIIAHEAGASSSIPFGQLQLTEKQQQYSMAFVMESEVHSTTGDAWARYNFIMTYNLDDSYPEPATYFDMNSYLVDLLTPPSVSFEDKEQQADIVWIISNCHAHNGREGFIQQLMTHIKIDSYGSCLHNRQGYGARMANNEDAYRKYKFVIAIENSNCKDYVTEKLVKAVASGSIPIVAGHDGRPDYQRYMPKHSYINIFDYSSIKELADDLKDIGNNKTLYESYLWYKKHHINISDMKKLSLSEKLKHTADVIGLNATMLTEGIAGKEKSENKICKLIRFIRQTSWQQIATHKKITRAGSAIACLPGRYMLSHFH